ncbi:MAG: hypothetical protein ACE5JN_15890 [Candidatus Methylomirabilia bacterium]
MEVKTPDVRTQDGVQPRREELYELVWSEPLTKVAPRHGVSDVALRKICRKMEVPAPPVGYWQRRRHGYQDPRASLPRARKGTKLVVTLDGARKAPPNHPHSPEAEALLGFDSAEESRVRVPDRLARPHPLVRQTAEALGRVKPDRWGLLRQPRGSLCLDIRVGPKSLGRALRIMDALVKAVEARGFRLRVSEGDRPGTYVELLGEELQVALEERTRRIDHVLTKNERERRAKWGSSWAPRWDYMPSGTLALSIKEFDGTGVRRTWQDGRRRRVEDMLNDVLAGLAVGAEAKRVGRLERERRLREWREEERRQVEAERRRQEEERRRQELERQAEAWAKAQLIRAYIDAVERAAVERGLPMSPDSDMGRWLQWAREQADCSVILK